jgi:hypothetical protein
VQAQKLVEMKRCVRKTGEKNQKIFIFIMSHQISRWNEYLLILHVYFEDFEEKVDAIVFSE